MKAFFVFVLSAGLRLWARTSARKLALSKPTVLNSFLHGEIPNLGRDSLLTQRNLATRPRPPL